MKREKIFKLIDLHLEERAGVPSNRELMWEELGEWQINSLKKLGLSPSNKLLDVGCGPLRFGTYAISYLENGNYHGVEVWEPYIKLGKRVLEEFGITKDYTMKIDRDFDYEIFGEKFDFAIAQSVVTHLSVHQIDKLLSTLKKVMVPGGSFLFSYINNKFPYSVYYEMEEPMITPSNLNDSFFRSFEKKYGLRFEKQPAGLDSHPTGQTVAVYQF
ncbi:MAG: class I SAM-dependent methyltransferase [Opitutae bacterium]|jgi:cyclopropane fatty-acyl-phospholipid synthase-like methyltransferase|nr:class I SAM-dependent methyltransferase [Opitutae bacterium]